MIATIAANVKSRSLDIGKVSIQMTIAYRLRTLGRAKTTGFVVQLQQRYPVT